MANVKQQFANFPFTPKDKTDLNSAWLKLTNLSAAKQQDIYGLLKAGLSKLLHDLETSLTVDELDEATKIERLKIYLLNDYLLFHLTNAPMNTRNKIISFVNATSELFEISEQSFFQDKCANKFITVNDKDIICLDWFAETGGDYWLAFKALMQNFVDKLSAFRVGHTT